MECGGLEFKSLWHNYNHSQKNKAFNKLSSEAQVFLKENQINPMIWESERFKMLIQEHSIFKCKWSWMGQNAVMSHSRNVD